MHEGFFVLVPLPWLVIIILISAINSCFGVIPSLFGAIIENLVRFPFILVQL